MNTYSIKTRLWNIILGMVFVTIASCITIDADTLKIVEENPNFIELPIVEKYINLNSSEIAIANYRVIIYKIIQSFLEGEFNFPGRIVLVFGKRISVMKYNKEVVFTQKKDLLSKNILFPPQKIIEGIIGGFFTRQSLTEDIPRVFTLYGKFFSNQENYFTFSGTAHEKTGVLNGMAQGADAIIPLRFFGTAFSNKKVRPQKTETGFILYQGKDVKGYVNLVGKDRVFIDNRVDDVNRGFLIQTMIFLLLYERRIHTDTIKSKITREDIKNTLPEDIKDGL